MQYYIPLEEPDQRNYRKNPYVSSVVISRNLILYRMWSLYIISATFCAQKLHFVQEFQTFL
jgi:hypothetical protein